MHIAVAVSLGYAPLQSDLAGKKNCNWQHDAAAKIITCGPDRQCRILLLFCQLTATIAWFGRGGVNEASKMRDNVAEDSMCVAPRAAAT